MKRAWTVTPEKIDAAIQQVVKVAKPQRIILFGSAARRGTRIPYDVDLLVVSPGNVKSPRRESVRIRRALRGIAMPMDILVISERRLREVMNRPGLVYREAVRAGKVVYDAAT